MVQRERRVVVGDARRDSVAQTKICTSDQNGDDEKEVLICASA
ncbi:hypothetical protein CES86_1412 [Brucella lupini]|uniref:Uncharacterized protein n=1 Tax=Brucella lupini TaxID=255457 RepID=A0A256GVF1_9HYPH|nr:hypothetical protein CES86_1412 [Brucella lupini]